jgi:peptide/nickel transport system permease protein
MFIIITFGFFLIKLAPGDVVDFMAAETGTADETVSKEMRQSFGLDRSTGAQLLAYYSGIARFDLGNSPRYGQPVTQLIAARLPSTLLLVGSAIVLALVLGVTFGALMASSPGGLRDRALSFLVLTIYSLPSFWIGLMLVILFAVKLGWLPAGGASSISRRLSGLDFALDRLRYLLLPALALASHYMAVYARLTRTAMLELSRQEFVRTAVSKGLTRGQVVRRHILRNALIPVSTMAGMHVGAILGGAVVVETIFAWPGMGRLTYEAVMSRDYQLLLGILLVSSVLVIISNILVDLLHGLLDPRMRGSQ